MSPNGSAPPATGRAQLTVGLEAQKAGDLDGAESIYRAALAQDPENADALHLLAIVTAQRGRVQEAIGLFRRAIALNDQAASFHGNLANALHRVGMTESAIAEYRRAIELDPGYSSAYSNLGNALRACSRRDEAVASYRRGCELNPRSPEGWNNLGIGLTETGKVEEAIACFKRALELRPRYREAFNNLGNAWHEAGDAERAIECFHRALDITPDDPGAQNNLAVVLQGLGRMDEAIERYRRALAAQPDYPEAHNNLGSAMFDLTRLDDAIACYRRALAQRPDYPEAEANCAHALLMKGDLAAGWPLYERRWEGSKDARGARRQIACPQWYGGPIEGKRILLHTEQGFGDALQFVRYVPLVAARGAAVVLECPPRMKRLFAGVEGVWRLVARGDPVPEVELHCPLLSLPLAFSTTLATIPARVPYLFPDAETLAAWRERIPRDGVLRVGLAWRGEPRNRNDYRRSLPLDALAPLAGIGNVRFYSLQVGTGESEAARPPAGMQLVDLTAAVTDFADTAALVAQLDLIISVDTAVAHLAGALGTPVWLLCRFESEWRWLLAREDSPWYPTMRIFRQARARDWAAVIDRVAGDLAQAARAAPVAGAAGETRAAADADRAAPPVVRRPAPRVVSDAETREALRGGIARQRAGDAAGAQKIYEELLARDPDCTDALHLLAIVRVESGQTEEGIALFRQAIAGNGSVAAYHGNLGDALARAGRLDEAIAECRRALEIDPASGAAYSSLGNALREKGALHQAIASYREACRLKPGSVEAWNNLGVALTGVGEFDEAVRCLKRSLELYPDGRDALHNLGNAQQRAGAPKLAEQCYARLLELDPRDARASDGMGIVLQDQERLDEAVARFHQALALKPDYPEAYNHLGGAYAEMRRVEEAIACYGRALELQPGNASAEWNCALALLSRGEFAEGWRLYERRWDTPKGVPSPRRPMSRPQWDGGLLEGRTILLHAEQGLGDTLQFVRYAPLVAARGARVVLECQPELKLLLGGMAGVAQLIARGEPAPDCDVHCPLLSLPRVFGTDLSTIPADVPYLAPDERRVERWHARMPGDAGLRVGLAWRGEPKNPTDRKRSVPLAALAPLARIRDAHFFSLQLGAGAQEAADPPPGLALIDLTGEIADFADTAALLVHLDLVICVDTAVAHLAGALGKPVWLLNRFESEWRWMLDREDSPWYPSLRIFRQARAGDWGSAIERVAAALDLVARGRVPAAPAAPALAARDAYASGDLAAAESLLRELAKRCPQAADVHTHLGTVLHAAGQRPQAVRAYLRALALDPRAADALNNLGGVLCGEGRMAAAIRCYGRATSLRPDYREAWNNLGLALTADRRPDAAIPCFERAVALDGTRADALVNLGKALRDAGMSERAAACLRKVLTLTPDNPEAYNNLANVLQEQGVLGEALALYRRALELRPDYPEARENCAYALLLGGNLAEGWDMYEWRAEGARSRAGIKRCVPLPVWDGSDLAGRRLLVTTEQGLGDEIMFASLLPEIVAMGARVLLESTGKPAGLFARSFPEVRVMVAGRTPEAWEARLAQLAGAAARADVQCALGSLARFLRASPDRFPRHTGYLKADPERGARWRERLAALGTGPKIGLSWRGGPPGPGQRRRSLDLAQLEPLFKITGVHFVSLQYTPCRDEIEAFAESTGCVLHHWQEAIDDYEDTAALVSVLDAVVSVCTAVVHLGGALGKAVWVMAPAVPEWRYGLTGEAMMWYPSVRVLRQDAPGDWAPVVARVQALLRESRPASARPSSPALKEALARAGSFDPGRAENWNALGARLAAGDPAAAVDCFVRALALQPDYREALSNLGNALNRSGQAERAIECLQRALALRPEEPGALNNLAIVLQGQGRTKEAIELYRRALAARPVFPEAMNNLASALLLESRAQEAIVTLRAALTLRAAYPEALNNLGSALFEQGAVDEAVACYRQALALRPDYPEVLGNLGSALALKRELPAAIECYRRALSLRPDYPEAEANFAYALLMHGEFAEGWARHERRWDASPAAVKSKRRFGRPQWDGRPAAGRTILLYAEQGFGDTIQFARYAPLVAVRGLTVVIECHPSLVRLLRAMPGVSGVVTRGETLPDFDLVCPLLSLPFAFGTTLQTIPDEMPYLRAESRLLEGWQRRFDAAATLRVGLAWRGAPRNRNDRKRSLPLAALAPLRRVAGARFYSLQIGGGAELSEGDAGLAELIDWTGEIEDFADTAALISCLDLVITVDTAVAHLAGALGKPVWMLCRFESEWRWLLHREDTPWYPSLRIFRQERDGDWGGAIERIVAQVTAAAAGRSARVPAERTRPAQEQYVRGELKASEDALRAMVVEWPAAADAWNNLGCVLQAAGKRADAVRHYLRALALNPLAADAHNNLGTALQDAGDLDDAILRYRRATELLPSYAQAWNNLGMALQRSGHHAGARSAFESAAQTGAGRAEAYYNLGNLAREEGRLTAAGDAFRRAIEVDPQYASAHWNHGLVLLFQGRYREAWNEYEWRWRAPEFRHLRRAFREPAWGGESLAGRTILLWSEQGLGDTLQFVRYAALVAGRGGRVVLETKPELTRLLAATPGVGAVVAQGDALPPFDCQLPLLSLPRIFETELDTIPADVPYVHAPPAEFRSWRAEMPQDGGLRVGVAWAGARRHPADGRRSIHPERFAPLAAVEGLHWFSLQQDSGSGPAMVSALPPLPGLVDTAGRLGDLADTAALVEHLDLVITVDSAVAHLAGAMGKPVWLLCRHESEWRWMLEREDSPWYPTVRIFRQEAPDDWTGVMQRVARELAQVTSAPDETRSDASAAARELFVANRLQEAERALRSVLSRQPAVASLLSDLSVIVGARGRHASALMLCDRALAIDPNVAAAHYNRGNALRDLGRPAEAVPAYQRAIELRPDYFKAFNNLGLAYKELDRLDEVQAQFDQALRLNPDFPDAHVNLGEVARLGAKLDEAERLFRRALELRPDFAEAHWNLGSLLLLRGDFEHGWPDYEWRWRLPELSGLQRGLDIPRWDGSDLAGRTLLLTAEQGLGDEIMFSSMIPEVAGRARRCFVECSARLAPLFRRSFPATTLFPVDRNRNGWEKELARMAASIPDIDLQCPLGSLPAIFRTGLGDFPAHQGYLRADPEKVAAWRARLQALGPGPKLGLSWRGGTKNTGLVRRSLDLARLASLIRDSGATFVSLQYTDCGRELAEFHQRTGLTVHHWQAAIDDYDETAALVCALDGVVTVCTAIVHLAGALGRPVWVMAPAVPEWRYGIAGEAMPWYPSVRVLRQRAEGEWEPVIAEVAARLPRTARKGEKPR